MKRIFLMLLVCSLWIGLSAQSTVWAEESSAADDVQTDAADTDTDAEDTDGTDGTDTDVSGTAFADASELDFSDSPVPEGVEAAGIALGGMTRTQAYETLVEYVEAVEAASLFLTFEDETVLEVALADIGVTIADASALENICAVASESNVLDRYKELAAMESGDTAYEISFTLNETALSELLVQLQETFDCEAEDATITRSSGAFVITAEVDGRELDVEETLSNVLTAFAEDLDTDGLTVGLSAAVTEAEHTQEELSTITDALGSYSTDFSSSSSNRKKNIARAAELINGTVVYPGETFSYLDLVTPLSEENGYYTATAYSSGKTVESIGGGVCQVSSTLYDAVLLAELDVTVRRNHSMTVSYVPLAMDATVTVSGGQDFQFENNYEYPVYIEAYTSNSKLTITIYGCETRAENRTIELVSVTEQTIEPGDDVITYDDTLEEGYTQTTQSAHTGYVAALYKYIYIDGELDSTELINRSTYTATPRYVTVGTKAVETQTETTAAETETAQTSAAETEAAQTEAAQETDTETEAAQTQSTESSEDSSGT